MCSCNSALFIPRRHYHLQSELTHLGYHHQPTTDEQRDDCTTPMGPPGVFLLTTTWASSSLHRPHPSTVETPVLSGLLLGKRMPVALLPLLIPFFTLCPHGTQGVSRASSSLPSPFKDTCIHTYPALFYCKLVRDGGFLVPLPSPDSTFFPWPV